MMPTFSDIEKKYALTIKKGILSTEEYYHTFLRYSSIFIFENTFANNFANQVLMYAQLYNKTEYADMINNNTFNNSFNFILKDKTMYVTDGINVNIYQNNKNLDNRFKYDFDKAILEKMLKQKHHLRLSSLEKIIKGIALSHVGPLKFNDKDKLFISKSVAQITAYALNMDTHIELSEVTSYNEDIPKYVRIANAINTTSALILTDIEKDIQILSKEQGNIQRKFATTLGISIENERINPKSISVNPQQMSLLQQDAIITDIVDTSLNLEEQDREPYVIIKWSESTDFVENERLTFTQADFKFKEVELAHRTNRLTDDLFKGYKKTNGLVFFYNSDTDTEVSEYQFRYDIGDDSPLSSGLYNHINSFSKNPEVKSIVSILEDFKDTAVHDTTEYFKLLSDRWQVGDIIHFEKREFIINAINPYSLSLLDNNIHGYIPITYTPVFMNVRNGLTTVYEELESNAQNLSRDNEQESVQIDEVYPTEVIETSSTTLSSATLATLDPVGPKLVEQSSVDTQFSYDNTDIDYGSVKTRVQNNIKTITLLAELDKNQTRATLEEQEVLSKYVGWGGIPHVFDSQKSEFKTDYDTLKEILSDSDYKSARASTLSAFYTDPNIIGNIYTAVKDMGFKGGNILEPSMGTGNFLSAMPSNMYNNSKIYGVELDNISGKIAKHLHPSADIQITGFEKTNFNNDCFDLVIGNVPFGDFTLSDNSLSNKLDLPKSFLIHDFFFAKALQKVKPNGIVAFITSSGTLDKKDSTVREYIHKRADFLGAIRLPNTAFKSIANTDVVSDIIFLQKREIELQSNTDTPDWVTLDTTDDGFTVNKYFVDNPNMVLGKFKHDTGQFGRTIIDVVNDKDFDLNIALKGSLLSIDCIRNIYDINANDVYTQTAINNTVYKENSFVVVNDELYYYSDGLIPQPQLKKAEVVRGKLLCELRDTYRDMINLQEKENFDEILFNKKKDCLNEIYDKIANSKNPAFLNSKGCNFFRADNDYFLLRSLENKYEYTKEEKLAATKKLPDKYVKSKAFSGPMISPPQKLVISNASQALTASIYKRGEVDLEYMSEIYGFSTDEIVSELSDKIIKNPQNSFLYETAEEYLSGNVKEKLAYAKKMVIEYPELEKNISALTAVLPKDLDISDIDFSLSSMWIPLDMKQEFMYKLFDVPNSQRINSKSYYRTNKPIHISYDKHSTAHTIINKPVVSYTLSATNTYGTKRKSGIHIFEETLNLTTTSVYDTIVDDDGKKRRVFNAVQTQLARNKQELINSEFTSFVARDINKIKDVERIYNEKFNNTVTRTYEGSDVIIDNMSSSINLRQHQKDSISRILLGGNTLLAHEVGSGKTFTMVASAMVLKQTGISKKSMIVVPNHLPEQWGHDFLQLFPTANILVATKKDFENNNRQIFINRIASGDYDAVILTFTQFEKIPLSPEFQRVEINEQRDELIDSLSLLDNKDDKMTIKQLEKHKKKLEERLEKLLQIDNKDNTLFFEQLGVDTLFVDEAHNYKNCFVATKLNNVAGVGKTSANKSEDLLMKTRYFHKKNNWNGGVVFATGTPITNSISELYVMQRYLQPQTLANNELSHFDAWASAFGSISEKMELAPEGKSFRPKMRFEKFTNLPELMKMFHEVADIKIIGDLDIQRPDLEGGKVAIVECSPSNIVTDYIDYLAKRADEIRKGAVDPSKDNMLKITLEAKKVSLDPRLIDKDLSINRESKIYDCCDKVASIYHETARLHTLQLIFIDFGMETYEHIKNDLITQGVDKKEIAFIHDAKTEKQKEDLFDKCRTGEIRVLLGSTQKMGAGTNIQDRMIALHHLDAPWRPADLTQRTGRIQRQGNMFDKVQVYQYVTKGTFDSYLFQTLENKQRFISQVITNKSPARSCSDIDETVLSYAEIKAIACDDPTLKERMELDTDIKKLQIEQSAFISTKKLYQNITHNHPPLIEERKARLGSLDSDILYYNSLPITDDFKILIDNVSFDNRADAGNALKQKIDSVLSSSFRNKQKIASFYEFDISLQSPHIGLSNFIITRNCSITIETGDSSIGNIVRLENTIKKIDKARDVVVSDINSLTNELNTALAGTDSEWSKSYLLLDKKNRLNELVSLAQKNEDVKNANKTSSEHDKFNDLHVDFSDSVDVDFEELDDEMDME